MQTTPIFDLKDTFDASIPIGDQELPIHIKRFARSELEAFELGWQTHFIVSRGHDLVQQLRKDRTTLDPTKNVVVTMATIDAVLARLSALESGAEQGHGEADEALILKRNAEAIRWMETAIKDAVTIDPGLVFDRGVQVVDGNGLIGVFHARKDVLGSILKAIREENYLGSVIRKNSNSPRASAPGSGPSSPTRGGDEPGSTATSAGPSGTAGTAAATDETEADPSGEIPKIH